MRWIATRHKSRGRGAPGRPQRIGLGRAPERKRKWKRQKRTDLHTNSQAICLYAANNARRSWNEWSAKRRFALQIEAPLYIMSWVHAEADNIHPSSSRIMRHMKKWRRMNRVSNQTAALKARRQKEEAGRDKKNHTRQVCSCLVVVETERKWSPTRCRKSHRWKPNVGAYTTTTTKLPSETAPPEAARTSEDSCRRVRTSAWSDLFFLAGRHQRQWVSSDNLCCESVSRAPRQKARPQVPTLTESDVRNPTVSGRKVPKAGDECHLFWFWGIIRGTLSRACASFQLHAFIV